MKAEGDLPPTDLSATVALLLVPGKELLAADESLGTIARRFEQVGIRSTEQTRRNYRELLFTAPGSSESPVLATVRRCASERARASRPMVPPIRRPQTRSAEQIRDARRDEQVDTWRWLPSSGAGHAGSGAALRRGRAHS
ncbi:MAG: class I fructose-bisphosphate aldolase [Chloroflexota bacterium]